MKIRVKSTKEVFEEIEIDLPYYYKQDLNSEYADCVIYGMIFETISYSIREKLSDGEVTYEFEVDEYLFIENSGMLGYFKPEYKSNKHEYEDAKMRAIEFIKRF